MNTKPCTVLPYPWHWVAPFTNDETLYRLVNNYGSAHGFVAVTYGGSDRHVQTYAYGEMFADDFDIKQLANRWSPDTPFEEAMLWVETMIATGAAGDGNLLE